MYAVSKNIFLHTHDRETPPTLHRGKYGVVFRASNKKTKEACAVKVMLKKGNKKDDVEREVSVLKKLKHPSILGFVEYHECSAEFVLVMEL